MRTRIIHPLHLWLFGLQHVQQYQQSLWKDWQRTWLP